MQMLITVHMLYVEMEANGVHVKTFVDSGAQMTIMTAVRACMRACRGLSLYHTLRSAVQASSTAWCRRCVALWVHACKPGVDALAVSPLVWRKAIVEVAPAVC